MHGDRLNQPGGIKAGGQGGAQLIAGHQDGARAQGVQVAHDGQVVVGLDSVAYEMVQALQRCRICPVVGRDAVAAVEVERAL